MKKTYTAPALVGFGDVTALTGTLGDPFTGDTSFDVDGNVIQEGLNSVDQCPTNNLESCIPGSTP